MWTQTYSKRIKGLSVDQIWQVWTDVDQWSTWQDDVEYSKMQSEFKTGGTFAFHPKGGPKLTLELTEVEVRKNFVDLTRFPLAKMYDSHEIFVHGDEIELKCTLTIKGPLSFLWKKIVAENVAKGIPSQLEALIARTHEVYKQN